MIVYHGFPLGVGEPLYDSLCRGRAVMVSFGSNAKNRELKIALASAASVTLDNGAYTIWRRGKGGIDLEAYYPWVGAALEHPSLAWFIAPDSIDGDEADNDKLLKTVPPSLRRHTVPVWHLHESFDRLKALLDAYPTVAFGSSGPYARPKSPAWWRRMKDAWERVPPLARIHGLRMADPEIGARVPLASCDSTTAGRHASKGIKFPQPFRGCRPETRVRAYMEYFETACVPPKNFSGASECSNALQDEVPWA